ncbi:hypothetical protein D3C78_1212020 [compost metagenome]
MVSWPARMRCRETFMASTGDRTRMSRPAVSWSFRYCWTFSISTPSWARCGSSQNSAGVLLARARLTASLTQSWIGASLVWHMRKMSPASTSWDSSRLPLPSTTRITPSALAWKVLSWEPYSSAFCAIRPTFGTLPMVVGSKAPCCLQSSITAW